MKSLLFFNPDNTLNTRGLDKYHGEEDGRFWNFCDYNNPIPLDPDDPSWKLFDYSTPPLNAAPADEGANGDDV
jgi:hypothetical protein